MDLASTEGLGNRLRRKEKHAFSRRAGLNLCHGVGGQCILDAVHAPDCAGAAITGAKARKFATASAATGTKAVLQGRGPWAEPCGHMLCTFSVA